MPKYNYSGEQAAFILPNKKRTVLNRNTEVEVSDEDHAVISKNKVIAALVEYGHITVTGISDTPESDAPKPKGRTST